MKNNFSEQEIMALIDSRKKIIEYLSYLWEKYPVMKIFIPNWEKYKTICDTPYDDALFESIFIIAKRNEKLDYLLNIFNKFCDVKIKIRKQYKTDLNELIWLSESDLSERYNKFNIYFGKIVEFLLAQYFWTQKYKIVNMQAWCETSSDIVIEKNVERMNIEVKWIGQYKQSFHDTNKGKNSFWINHVSANENIILKIKEVSTYFKNKKDLIGSKVAGIIIFPTSFGDYFISQETCCTKEEDVIEYQKNIYNISDLDEVQIYMLEDLQIEHFYTYDIKNKRFYNFKSKK